MPYDDPPNVGILPVIQQLLFSLAGRKREEQLEDSTVRLLVVGCDRKILKYAGLAFHSCSCSYVDKWYLNGYLLPPFQEGGCNDLSGISLWESLVFFHFLFWFGLFCFCLFVSLQKICESRGSKGAALRHEMVHCKYIHTKDSYIARLHIVSARGQGKNTTTTLYK